MTDNGGREANRRERVSHPRRRCPPESRRTKAELIDHPARMIVNYRARNGRAGRIHLISPRRDEVATGA